MAAWGGVWGWAWAYGAALLVIGALDALWLGVLAKDFYRSEMAAVAAPNVRLLPAALFYLAYPAGLMALALVPAPGSLPGAVLRAALVGLVAYATYDLTNMATLKQWSWGLALTDAVWGTFLSAAAGGAAYWTLKRLA